MKSLLSMEKKDLVKCVTPDEPNYRYYEITDVGKKISSLANTKV